jgi:hypothetical protein
MDRDSAPLVLLQDGYSTSARTFSTVATWDLRGRIGAMRNWRQSVATCSMPPRACTNLRRGETVRAAADG